MEAPTRNMAKGTSTAASRATDAFTSPPAASGSPASTGALVIIAMQHAVAMSGGSTKTAAPVRKVNHSLENCKWTAKATISLSETAETQYSQLAVSIQWSHTAADSGAPLRSPRRRSQRASRTGPSTVNPKGTARREGCHGAPMWISNAGGNWVSAVEKNQYVVAGVVERPPRRTLPGLLTTFQPAGTWASVASG